MRFPNLTMTTLAATVLLLAPATAQSADACFQDRGQQAQFGSSEQVLAVQQLANGDCAVIGVLWRIDKPFAREAVLVADLKAGVLARLKIDRGGRPWETWSGFTRAQLLKDDPSDGFDLPKFQSSSKGTAPKLTPAISKLLQERGLTRFLPG